MDNKVAQSSFNLYQPMPSYRMGGGGRFGRASKTTGQNHPGGVMVHYYLNEKPADSVEVKLSFHTQDGELIRAFSTKAKERADKLEVKENGNRFVWNMRYPAGKSFKGMIMWAGRLTGPAVVPGNYKVKLTVGDQTQEQNFEILKDPRSESSLEDMQAQFTFLKEVVDKASEAHQAIIDIRDIRQQIKTYTDKFEG